MAENLLNSPEKIINRLEELRLWQENEEKMLKERQEAQRKMLTEEQQKLYELLGLSAISENYSDLSKNAYIIQSMEDSSRSINNTKFNEVNSEESLSLNVESKDQSGRKLRRKIFNNNSETIPEDRNMNEEKKENVPKRRFLKRGEGIKSRFKVDPNKYRLNNLPRYQYAGTHKKFKSLKPIQQNPEIFQSQQETKVINKHYLSLEKSQISPRKKKTDLEVLPKAQSGFRTSAIEEHQNSVDLSVFNSIGIKSENNTKKITDKINEPVSWANVLDPNNIQPITVDSFRDTAIDDSKQNTLGEDTDNLSLFELLEQKAQEGSFALDAINIKKWIKNKARELQEESEALKINTEHMKKSKIQPYPFDVEEKLIPDESDSNNTSYNQNDSSDTQTEEEVPNCKSVRFAEQIVEINHTDESETETVRSIEYNNTSNSTPNFERFKQRLFSVETHNDESTITEQITDQWDHDRREIIEKSELLKEKLIEVESEISRFKDCNLELMKMKQEHELERFRFQQECIEAEEKLKDEKLKFEIYSHDERLKVEEEKRKLDKLIRDQKAPNRKERDETLKLREELERVQKDLKEKESKHVSAQARLRAKIRNDEKEIKELMFEIEHLKKENKKLECENGRLSSLQSNNMLKEINKKLAKLAPKDTLEECPPKNGIKVTEVRNRNPKQVVAKVVKHITPPKESDISSLGPDSSDDDTSEPVHRNKTQYDRHCKPKPKKNYDDLTRKKSDLFGSKNTKEFKREIQNNDGSKEIWYPNGNIEKVSSDGMLIKMLYFNKDMKETDINEGTVKYYYAETNTWQTSYSDGLEIFEFPSGITEHRHKDGTIETRYPNGSIRKTNPNDKEKHEEWTGSDGTQFIKFKSGDTLLKMPNGQREITTKVHSRREYPDGTVKIVYPDRSQETRYSNGRVRIKDKDGNLVMDSNTFKY